MDTVTLTSAMSSNLLALKQTSSAMSEVQHRLATGLKVNSAMDNPSAYYTAVSLSNRASDLNSLLDNMGQAIQTVKAATMALETGTAFLEQARAVADQALTQATAPKVTETLLPEVVFLRDNSAELIAAGYTAITADMTQDEVQALLDTDNAKLFLAEDVSFDSLSINGSNVVLDGAGHKFTATSDCLNVYGNGAQISNMEVVAEICGNSIYMSGASDAKLQNLAVKITGANDYQSGFYIDSSSDISLENVSIEVKNSRNVQIMGIESYYSDVNIKNVTVDMGGRKDGLQMGVYAEEEAKLAVEGLNIRGNADFIFGAYHDAAGSISGISHSGKAVLPSGLPGSWYDGKANTQAIINQIGSAGLAASAANQFYVGDKNDANFGQGKWYLPAIGELMEAYGYNAEGMSVGYGTSGMTGENKAAINAALSTLKGKGAEAEALTNNWYWSSSE